MFLGVEGIVVLELEGRRVELGPGQAFTVAHGTPHRTSPVGAYSVNLTFEPANLETVAVEATTGPPLLASEQAGAQR